jgi:hypothetical protein
VQDSSPSISVPQLLWSASYPGAQFQASAGIDTRNGANSLWVYPIVATQEDGLLGSTCESGSPPSNVTTSLNCLIRLDASTGAKLQQVDPTKVLGSPNCSSMSGSKCFYFVTSAVIVSTEANGNHALTVGAASPATTNPYYEMTFDVTDPAKVDSPASMISSFSPSASNGVFGQLPANLMGGQFATVTSSTGKIRTVFTTADDGPYFVGDPD